MAGHSKWANIKHRKAAQDAKKGKVFTKLIREITISARLGGGNPADNPRLRAVIDKALIQNMSRDTIDRAIKRGVGGEDGAHVEEITYEGYAPGGVAVLVETMTDNRNRTVSEVRHAFTKHGGNLGATGAVSYLFARKGQLTFAPGANEEKIMEIALESDADDVVTNEDNSIDVYTSAENFEKVQKSLEKAGLKPENAEVGMIPDIYVTVEGEAAATVQKMLDMLEDLDDVQNVYSNADLAIE